MRTLDKTIRRTKITKRTFVELDRLRTFDARFEYLKLRAEVGSSTFGFDRYLNQAFYTSAVWRSVRNAVISRDSGCDLGIPGREIHDRVIIHHMNPMTVQQVDDGDPDILNIDYLITVSHRTHNAIHFGDASMLPKPLVERRPGDTALWEPRQTRRRES